MYTCFFSFCLFNKRAPCKVIYFEETEATFGYLYRHVMFWKGVMTCSQSVQGENKRLLCVLK